MILLFLFCILFGLSGGSMIYHNDPYDKHIIDKQDKPIQEVVTVNQYDIYTMADLFSTDAMANYVSWIYLADGVSLPSITSTYNRGFDVSGSMYFNYIDQTLTLSNMVSDNQRFMTIQTITFTANPKTNGNNGSWRQFYSIHFVSTTSTSRFIEVKFNCVYNANMNGTYTWYTGSMGYTTNGGSSFSALASTLGLVSEYQQTNINGWSRSFLPYNVGGSNGYATGYNDGYSVGASSGYATGYNDGYDAGYADADGNFNMNPEMLTIFTGILEVALLPVNVFLSILNFEVFGINIAGFVTSLLTVAIVIIIVRFIFGGKSND